MVNATGWTELFEGNLIKAAFVMYDTAMANWFVAILFFVYQALLLIKTRNLNLAFITGIIFLSLYAVSSYVKTISVQVMFVLMVFELAGILYFLIWK